MKIDRFTFQGDGYVPMSAFESYLLSKCQWAWVLGIEERTIRNWEKEIINQDEEIARFYHFKLVTKGEKVYSPKLDNYRRFVILIIRSLKSGLYDGNKHKNSDVLKFLISNKDKIKRSKFNEWRKKYESQRVSR